MKRVLLLLAVLGAICVLLGSGVGLTSRSAIAADPVVANKALPKQEISFNRDIKPIFAGACMNCHGSDPGTRKAGLRIDREEGLFGNRKGGQAVVKGDPARSLLYKRIVTDDEDDLMPPPKSNKVLTKAQKDLVKRWIEQGAPWEEHWSLIPPRRPPVPYVKNGPWVSNPIDAFILAELEKKGLAPAPPADPRTLARRLAYDLTGLPPEPAEVEALVKDSSVAGYDRLMARLLASPQYGEHRARYWLDAARYADTHGLHFDNYREIWPYRDWVIEAFNRNMPFDQFTVEQLAGDLLREPSLEQRVASGFLRCQITTNEGGTIAEENLVMYTRERTETVARVWMGLTMNCCVCHDHKFDPITMKDFYSMSAFLNNASVAALDGNVKDSPPSVLVPATADRPRYAVLAKEIGSLKGAMDQRRREARAEFNRWLATANVESLHAGVPTRGLRLAASLSEGAGSKAKMIIDEQPREVALASTAQWQAGHIAPKAIAVSQGAVAELPDAGDFDRNQAFTCAVWAKLPGKVTGAVVGRMLESEGFRGWDLWIEGDRVGSHIIHKWDEDALKVVTNKPVDPSKWHHLCISYDGSGKAAGVRIYVDGEPQPTRVLNDKLKNTTRTTAPLKIGQRNASSPIKGLLVQDLRLYGRALSAGEVKQIVLSTRLSGALAKAPPQRSEAEKKDLYDWWLGAQDGSYRDLAKTLGTLEQEESSIKSRGAVSLVMGEKAEKPKAWILFRGEYDKRRDEVGPAVPAVLPAMPDDLPRNRLGLAQWLLRPEHPLTARVAVNRIWQEIFGTGLVKTPEDFGITGEEPSHPELLDWLAIEFRESGWDVKRLMRLILSSSTYRQSAVATPEKLEKDPANRLLSRGPRFRMDAEMIRDSALVASGLLISKIGGPSVRPYQPPGVWEAVAMPGSTTREYKQDHGESLYRRSLYTFWKRAAPPASMEVLNAPSRETCTVRRERTNTPLQALLTLNDVQYIEAARHLAQRAISEGGKTFDGRLAFITGRVLSRTFTADEAAVVRSALDDLLKHYKSKPDDAKQLIAVGEFKRDESLDPAEHAAWTMVVNQILNLDESLNK